MNVIVVSQKGDFRKTFSFLGRHRDYLHILNTYGQRGVELLREATPVDTGRTAESWSYDVQKTNDGYEINWYNSSTNKGISIAILNQYGHATRDGGWVQGIDYINPALKPVFMQMADDLWREATT